jgi:predicted N-acetyltransferase YhbS
MIQYTKGTPADAQDIIDFAELIFSRQSGPHDFSQLIPKLYRDGEETQQHHYLVKEDGKIKAMVCVLPVTFNVAGIELKAGCIGTVSVHPSARGKGYMKKLMNMALEDMKSQGYAFSALGGQRQRYEYFGYEPAGIKLNFTLTADNVRHKYSELDTSTISFEPLTNESSQLDDAYDLYQKGVVNSARSKDRFVKILQTWNTQPYIVLHEGKFAGYAAVTENGGVVQEIEVIESSMLPVVCKALMSKLGLPELQFILPAYDRDKITLLGQVCEMYAVSYNQNFNIMDYASVIEAFMKCKAQYVKLLDGRFVLEIEGYGAVEICVQNNHVHVKRYDAVTDIQVDAHLSKREATALLFSSLSEFSEPTAQQLDCPSGWLPLPLYVPPLDGC